MHEVVAVLPAGSPAPQASGTRTWGIAEEKAADLQRQLDAGGAGVIPLVIKAEQPTIADCIETFISAKESEGISPRRMWFESPIQSQQTRWSIAHSSC
jgi:hypothetical protein